MDADADPDVVDCRPLEDADADADAADETCLFFSAAWEATMSSWAEEGMWPLWMDSRQYRPLAVHPLEFLRPSSL